MMVSDHALLRWLDRVHGIDVEWLRATLVTQLEDHHAPGMGTLVQDGMLYHFADDVLVTIVPKKKKTKKRL